MRVLVSRIEQNTILAMGASLTFVLRMREKQIRRQYTFAERIHIWTDPETYDQMIAVDLPLVLPIKGGACRRKR